MKMRDATNSGKQLENMTPMMYNMSLQQDKAHKPFKPQIYQQKGREQRKQNYNRDKSRNNDRQGQNFGQIRHSYTTLYPKCIMCNV